MPVRFIFQSFDITKTRSEHEDTNYLALGMSIDGVPLPPQTQEINNVNNGLHIVDLSIALPEQVNDASKFVFSFLMVNHGGDSPQNVLNACSAAMTNTLLKDFVAADAVPSLAPGTANITVPVCVLRGAKNADDLNALWHPVNAQDFEKLQTDHCDGVVVIDRFSFTGASISNMVLVKNFGCTYFGPSSRDGCGADSQYNVAWSVAVL